MRYRPTELSDRDGDYRCRRALSESATNIGSARLDARILSDSLECVETG